MKEICKIISLITSKFPCAEIILFPERNRKIQTELNKLNLFCDCKY